MGLKIENSEQNGNNGHITIHCRVVTKDGNNTIEGARESHGIDPVSLENLYGGDIDTFLRATHDGMKARHECRQSTLGKIQSLRGKVIEFESEDENAEQAGNQAE